MKLRILEIGPDDAWFRDRARVIGKVVACPEEEGRDCETNDSDPSWLFLFSPEGLCFYQCRVEIVWEDDDE